MRPISSMWPISAQLGPPRVPAMRAMLVPSVSLVTSAKPEAAPRQTAAGRSSTPDGPGARSSSSSRGGTGTADDSTLTTRPCRDYGEGNDSRGSRIVYANEAEACGEPVVGYLAYDHVAKLEPTVRLPDDGPGLPESRFVVAEALVRFDHVTGVAEVLAGDSSEIASLFTGPAPDTPSAGHRAGPVRRLPDQARYEEMVRAAKEEIRRGEAFQIVLS